MKKAIALVLALALLAGVACTPKKDENTNQNNSNQPTQQEQVDDLLSE